VDLFDQPHQPEDNQRLLRTIDEVADKFGKGMLQVGISRRIGKSGP
jgi:hypothetical protein